ncbi:hypothetical protein [uncultured Ilyobacter sp.]|uniref:hypothetical protein n=1 Tax=uncultured Ilyobacter sp. TaxID=544433 RepID=UPI0029F49858|nr:hypothetical protein [uncultured Ilyobacter sp.]
MRKKILVLFILILSVLSFSQIKDNLGSFSDEEVKKIEERMEEISKNSELDLYINTYKSGGNNTQLKVLEKSVIIDMVKVDNEHLNVKLSFSQDIDISPYQEELENVLGNLGNLITEGENEKYTLELLSSLEDIFKRMGEDKEIQKEKFSKSGNLNGVFLFLVFLGIGIFVGKNKKVRELFSNFIKNR